MDHAGLKNLGFTESGHTGFQPALSDEQIGNIDAVAGLKENISRLVRKITVQEDVVSVTISTDEEGNPFLLNDFEIRFCGKHASTMWFQIGKGEKYFSTNQIANNNGLPFFNTTANYLVQNAIAHYTYAGTNFYGIRIRQEIGTLVDGKYGVGAGDIVPFSTSPVNSNVSTINITAISGGVINAGSVIEIWGY